MEYVSLSVAGKVYISGDHPGTVWWCCLYGFLLRLIAQMLLLCKAGWKKEKKIVTALTVFVFPLASPKKLNALG